MVSRVTAVGPKAEPYSDEEYDDGAVPARPPKKRRPGSGGRPPPPPDASAFQRPPKPPPAVKPTCPRFNGKKGCTPRGRDCPEGKRHVCDKCGAWSHGASSCNARKR